MKFSDLKILPALLLATASYGAWSTQGLADCSGLFLLDQKNQKIQARSCTVKDSTQVKNISAVAGYTHVGIDLYKNHIGKDDLYSWKIKTEESEDIGYAAVQADFRYLDFRIDVYSFPFFIASTNWYMPDSIVFAGAALGQGDFSFLNFSWVSASDLSVIPNINATFADKPHYRQFDIGTKIQNHTARFDFLYGDTDPSTEESGYIFSDSSHFWATNSQYTYSGTANTVSLLYTYLTADVNAFGLLRENNSVKRFFFVPAGIDINMFKADFRHLFGTNPQTASAFSARAIFLDLKLALLWDDRRFYETLAPNRALTSSIVKTLSFSVYNRSFRIYGTAQADVLDAGLGYEWNRRIGMFRIKPILFADFFYAKADIDLRNRNETSNMLYSEHTTDTLIWELDVAGSLVNLGVSLETPKHFFAAVNVYQIIPFYFNLETPFHKETPEEEIPPPGPDIPPPGPDQPPPEIPVETPPKSRTTLKSIFSGAFRNGFAINAQIGLRF
ncbi:MAG: hypothetical protein J6U20_10810 [Fibrobacter sp.]|nr:hypothetical protein [Fibrobacter sp.]